VQYGQIALNASAVRLTFAESQGTSIAHYVADTGVLNLRVGGLTGRICDLTLRNEYKPSNRPVSNLSAHSPAVRALRRKQGRARSTQETNSGYPCVVNAMAKQRFARGASVRLGRDATSSGLRQQCRVTLKKFAEGQYWPGMCIRSAMRVIESGESHGWQLEGAPKPRASA
jgi:hypothetical protein